MNFKTLLTIFILSFFAFKPCYSKETNDRIVQKRDIISLDSLASKSDTSTLGILQQNIQFEVKSQDKDDFEDGIKPWININSPGEDLKKLAAKDDIIITDRTITIIIDYPLTIPYRFEMQSFTGFTRLQLIKEISKRYHLIYKEERTTTARPVIPVNKRGTLLNRNKTDGKYGIWGHDITDLDLSSISVYKSADGKIYLSLQIES